MKYTPKHLEETADASRGVWRLSDWAQGMAGLIIFAAVGYVALGSAADYAARNLSDAREVQLFSWLDIDSDDTPASESKRQGHAEKLFRDLVTEAKPRPLDYRFFAIDLEDPNAFALPGGAVGVATELLEALKTDIGLSFVLAHELGHHQHRHAVKRVSRSVLMAWALSLIGLRADFQETSPLLGVGTLLADLAYSREHEMEADRYAMELVHKRFGTTEGALEFFEFLEKHEGKDEAHWRSLLSTHPLTSERIAALEGWRAR